MIPRKDGNDENVRLYELIDLAIDGRLDADQHHELSDWLRRDEKARVDYIRYVDLHFDLLKLHAPAGDVPLSSGRAQDLLAIAEQSYSSESITDDSIPISRLSGLDEKASFDGKQIDGPVRSAFADNFATRYESDRARTSRYLSCVLLLAGCLMLIVGWRVGWPSQDGEGNTGLGKLAQSPSPTVDAVVEGGSRAHQRSDIERAVDSTNEDKGSTGSSLSPTTEVILSQIAAAKFFGESVPPVGERLRKHHEYALSTGSIELRFPTGATTILEAPSVFSIDSESKLLMKTGRCSVHAPDGAEGFVVDTPLASVVDLGTRFSVVVTETGETDVQVIEGEADVLLDKKKSGVGMDHKDAINLKSGQAQRLLPRDEVVTQSIPYQGSTYKPRLRDRVIRYAATKDESGGSVDLLSVDVQRGGEVYQYTPDQFIPYDLVHLTGATGSFLVTPPDAEDPALRDGESGSRAQFNDRDHNLCSGFINIGGQTSPMAAAPVLQSDVGVDQLSSGHTVTGSPGMAIRFQQPLINSHGPDLVVFDLQTIVDDEHGDAFHLMPLPFVSGRKAKTVSNYDIDLLSPEAHYLGQYRLYRRMAALESLQQGLSAVPEINAIHVYRTKALAVAIDLSSLGVPEGQSVEGLFFQDSMDDRFHFDPVLIVGLPPVDEP